MQFTVAQILDDVIDPLLDVRLRGDLTLLAEDLNPDAAINLASGMADLAHGCVDPVSAIAVVDHCKQLLGVTTSSRIARTRRRRNRGSSS